jgi:hypothetical protein
MAPSEKQEVKKTSKISTKEKEMLQEESISEELPDSSESEAVAMQNIRNRKRRDVLAEKISEYLNLIFSEGYEEELI